MVIPICHTRTVMFPDCLAFLFLAKSVIPGTAAGSAPVPSILGCCLGYRFSEVNNLKA